MTSQESMLHKINNSVEYVPQGIRTWLLHHHEFIKFAIVGCTTMLVDIAVFYTLTLTCMDNHPTSAKIIAGAIAMCVSYILNSNWSFKNRGGNMKSYEVTLFFTISTLGIVIGAFPEYIVNSLSNWRSGHYCLMGRIFIDFFLNYIVGNLAQMIFRFWALRKFAYPEQLSAPKPLFADTPAPVEISPILTHAHPQFYSTSSNSTPSTFKPTPTQGIRLGSFLRMKQKM